MTTPPVPVLRSYWVIPGKLLASYYPGSKDPKDAAAKLTALINAGIRHVINLMEPDERDFTGHRFVPYDDMMESIAAKMRISVTFDQLPIKDLSVPTDPHMTRILNQIDLCNKHGKPVYVHCLGGIGRTGTVVGCYLVRHDLATGKNVLEMISDLRKDSEDADRRSPETKEQREMVVNWKDRDQHELEKITNSIASRLAEAQQWAANGFPGNITGVMLRRYPCDVQPLTYISELNTEDELSGREVTTEAGKIDILAKDTDSLVVIELKASKATYSTLGQIHSYMASIKVELKAENVRGIIVAEEFDKKLMLAVTQANNVKLIKYKVKFDFEAV